MILQGLKPRIFNKLNKFGRRWLAELPSVIWGLRTTPSRATGFTPFFLVFTNTVFGWKWHLKRRAKPVAVGFSMQVFVSHMYRLSRTKDVGVIWWV